MGQANIAIAYVNPPKAGKKNGSVKTKTGEMFGVPPEKLDQFQQGGEYAVEYSERQFNGQTYRTIIAATLMQPPVQSRSNDTGKYGNKDDATAERIFVCGALNAHVSSGQAEMSAAYIGNIVNILREVWRTEMAGPAKNADMGEDSIPF